MRRLRERAAKTVVGARRDVYVREHARCLLDMYVVALRHCLITNTHNNHNHIPSHRSRYCCALALAGCIIAHSDSFGPACACANIPDSSRQARSPINTLILSPRRSPFPSSRPTHLCSVLISLSHGRPVFADSQYRRFGFDLTDRRPLPAPHTPALPCRWSWSLLQHLTPS